MRYVDTNSPFHMAAYSLSPMNSAPVSREICINIGGHSPSKPSRLNKFAMPSGPWLRSEPSFGASLSSLPKALYDQTQSLHRFTTSLLSQTLATHVPFSPKVSLFCWCFGWYLFSAINSTLKKHILIEYNYPLTLLCLQSICTLWISLGSAWPLPLASFATLPWKLILVMAACHFLSGACNTLALARSSVALIHTVKALAPFITCVLYTVLWRRRTPRAVWLSFLPLTVGVLLTCHFETHAAPLGPLLALLAIVFHCSQHLVCKSLLETVRSPLLMFLASATSTLVLLPLSLSYEQPAHPPPPVLALVLLSGITHALQVALSYIVLKRLDALTFPITALFKRLFIIAVSILWFRTPLASSQTFGMALAFFGLYLYYRATASS